MVHPAIIAAENVSQSSPFVLSFMSVFTLWAYVVSQGLIPFVKIILHLNAVEKKSFIGFIGVFFIGRTNGLKCLDAVLLLHVYFMFS